MTSTSLTTSGIKADVTVGASTATRVFVSHESGRNNGSSIFNFLQSFGATTFAAVAALAASSPTSSFGAANVSYNWPTATWSIPYRRRRISLSEAHTLAFAAMDRAERIRSEGVIEEARRDATLESWI